VDHLAHRAYGALATMGLDDAARLCRAIQADARAGAARALGEDVQALRQALAGDRPPPSGLPSPHDLRQPVHALNLYLGALAAHELPAQARPVLAQARACAHALDEMVRERLDAARAAPQARKTPCDETLAGAQFIVIDDEPSVLQATCALLQAWGCEVLAGASGAEALRLAGAATRTPDAIICDYRLGRGESGLDVIEALRGEFNQDIPALLVTGEAAVGLPQRTPMEGLEILYKPLQEHALRAALTRLVALARRAER
jgi:CheY-like chemotaxis protein